MTRSALSGPFWLSALLVLPAALGGCMRTSTYGTGEMPEMAMFREVTGGLLDKNKKPAPIDYQPRAPLVMPPPVATAGQLPPPAEAAADATPDWPVDRDQLTAAADARVDDDNPRNDINQAEYRRLKPLQGVFPQQARQDTFVSGDSGKDDYYNTVVHGREQREQFAKAVAESKGFGQTNERRFLTDPPIAYRQPVSADPSQPPAVIDEPKGNFITRWWRRH